MFRGRCAIGHTLRMVISYTMQKERKHFTQSQFTELTRKMIRIFLLECSIQ